MDLSLLPPDLLTALTWLVVALLSVCSLVGLVSLLLLPAKRLLGLPTPLDPPWKVRAFKIVKLADVVAATRPRAVEVLTMMKHELELASQKQALAKQHQVIEQQERQIRVQAAVISASQRPPPMDDEVDTSKQSPTAKRQP